MSAAKKPPTVTERVRKHRKNLKRAGMRPIQIWVPNTRNPKFAEECRRQSLLIANDPHESEILEWIEQVQDTTDWK
ncbi:MAG TPA: antitoxin MazE family protein [Bryobacteraceae bacterium]|nr:antitoxin MazE family protein [Bryobacteraceae bacterium]